MRSARLAGARWPRALLLARETRARATRTGGYHKKYFCATCGFWCKKDKFARDHEAEQEDGLTRCTPGRKPDRKRKWTETQTQTIIKRVSAANWGDSDAEYEALWQDVVDERSSLTLEQLKRKVEYIMLSTGRSSGRGSAYDRSAKRARQRKKTFSSSDDDDSDDDDEGEIEDDLPLPQACGSSSSRNPPRAAAKAARTQLARAMCPRRSKSPRASSPRGAQPSPATAPIASPSPMSETCPPSAPAGTHELGRALPGTLEPARPVVRRPVAPTLPPLQPSTLRGGAPRPLHQTESDSPKLQLSGARLPPGIPQGLSTCAASSSSTAMPTWTSGLGLSLGSFGQLTAAATSPSAGGALSLAMGSTNLWAVETQPIGSVEELLGLRETDVAPMPQP